MISNNRFLVTGGAGFIGSNITNFLLKNGNHVKVLDNFATGQRKNLIPFENNKNVEIIEGDLRSYHQVKKAVEGVDYVLHQGALPSVPRSISDPITSNEVNVNGTVNLLHASMEAGVKRLVYASSSSIYGDNPEMAKNENLPVRPLSPYAISKYAAERYCQVFYQIYGFETVALRYFNVFGPNQDPTSQYSAVIPKFIKSILEGKSPEVHGDGKQSRDFTYVENNIRANILACTAEGATGKVFNIACGQSFSLLDLIEKINKFLGVNIEPFFVDSRLGDVKHSLADIRMAKEILHYEPEYNFDYGLEKTIEFFKNNF